MRAGINDAEEESMLGGKMQGHPAKKKQTWLNFSDMAQQ